MKTSIFVTWCSLFALIFLPSTSQQAMNGNTISISLSDLINVSYSDGFLFLDFKKSNWEKIRTFTSTNIGKQVVFKIDSEIFAKPHVSSPFDSRGQLFIDEQEAKKLIKKFQKLNKNRVTYSQEERVEFLKNWLRKNPYDSLAFSDVIMLLHETKKLSDCKIALDFFEEYPIQKTKEHALKNCIFQIVDCYSDLSMSSAGIELLISSLQNIYTEDLWSAYDYIAYLYENEKKPEEAIKYYQKALNSLDDLELQLKKEYAELGLDGFSEILDAFNKDRARIMKNINILKLDHR